MLCFALVYEARSQKLVFVVGTARSVKSPARCKTAGRQASNAEKKDKDLN